MFFYRYKMKIHLLKGILVGCVFLLLQEVAAQKVKPIKVTETNARAFRDSLKKVVFGSIVFPYDIMPDSVVSNVNSLDLFVGFPYNSILYPLGNLDSIDKFVVKLGDNTEDFPEKIKVYLFHPHNSNGKLFIYHSGHCAGIAPTEDIMGINSGAEPGFIIPSLLEQGYTVLAVPMLNYKLLSPIGLVCGYNNHDALFTEGHYQYPLSFFFKPLIASLNLLGRSNYSSIYMCGLSGGGWTTSIYPAMDSSISYAFPVAGSWPIPVRNAFYPNGDAEQYYGPLFKYLLDYHEIYALACLAPARKMLQINNRYDACCFAGAYPHIFYADSVAKALQGTDGLFKFYLDETEADHTISPRALEVMLTFIRGESASLQNLPADSADNGTDYLFDIKNNFSVNTAPDNSTLKYSLLKAPSWLSLDGSTGRLAGVVPVSGIIAKPDSISFKVEDSTGRFVVYNYNLTRKRDVPYFFTMFADDKTIYCLPPYSNSLSVINPLNAASFYFNNPSLVVTGLGIENNSVIKITLNAPVTATDSIGYNGFANPFAVTYNNGVKMGNFGLTSILLNAVTPIHAVSGMIRFNTETKKFEYFNGAVWINMN